MADADQQAVYECELKDKSPKIATKSSSEASPKLVISKLPTAEKEDQLNKSSNETGFHDDIVTKCSGEGVDNILVQVGSESENLETSLKDEKMPNDMEHTLTSPEHTEKCAKNMTVSHNRIPSSDKNPVLTNSDSVNESECYNKTVVSKDTVEFQENGTPANRKNVAVVEEYVYDESRRHKLDSETILTALTLNDSDVSEKENEDNPPQKLVFSPSRHKLSDTETPCMLCSHVETNMNIKSHYDEYLCHLLVEHKLVIADVKLIADLQSYALYWKKRFEEEGLDQFCSKIVTNTGAKDVAKSEEYYLLCDNLPEDKKIREELQFKKLQKLLLRQEFERNDETFSRRCPFCIKMFHGNRLILFNHMTEDHNFNIGHPDNIVNVRELLDDIQLKLDALQCLFCENTFRDRVTLREHMRKKGHRRLNPKNKDYDKYYTINYLELGKNWQVLQGESDKLDPSDDWSGWIEEAQKAYCFFCSKSFDEADKVYAHMKEGHDFDFVTLRLEMQLSFYQQIKLINYIRREVHLTKQEKSSIDIVSKVKDSLKSSTKWNQPQYYFSTYEDDSLLCHLEDTEGLIEPEDNFVIGEDGMDCRSIVSNSVLTDLVVGGYFDS